MDFDNKRAFFRAQLQKQKDEGEGVIRLNVRRNQVFEDSYHQLRLRTAAELKGKLSVHFVGEEV